VNVFIILSDNADMKVEGYTITELSKTLNITSVTVRQRLHIAGIKPLTKEAIYPKSALEAIRNVPGRGRPPKAKPEDRNKVKKGKK
jgi:hypothetical protein